MKRYDPTILYPTVTTAVVGILFIMISANISNIWVSGLLIGLGINIFSIGLTLLCVDMYKWYIKRKIYRLSYDVIKVDLLGILGHPSVWLLDKYASSKRDKDLLKRAIRFNDEASLEIVARYVSDELLRLLDKDENLNKIKHITKEDAKWLRNIVTSRRDNLRDTLELYSHLIDDPELIDEIAKLRRNMINAETALDYLSGDNSIPMSLESANNYVKYMFRSYADLILYIKSL